MNGGHGHVTPRPDGGRARCGGPRRCRICADELAALVTIPGQLVAEGPPGALDITHASDVIRMPLEHLIRAGTVGVAAILEKGCVTVTGASGRVTYRVTGWDLAAAALVCERVNEVSPERGRQPA